MTLSTMSDPRTRRTVARLRDALRAALDRGSLERVTVSSICRDAGVRRTTFYSHYEDVGNLLIDVLTGEIDEVLGVPEPGERTTPQLAREFRASLSAAFEVVGRDRAEFRTGFESAFGLQLRASLERLFVRRVAAALEMLQANGAAVEVDVHIAPVFVGGGLAAAVANLACACTTERDIRRYTETVSAQLPWWWPRVDG